MDYAAIFDRHPRAAFHLSGGKDSVAALYWLSEYADRFTVYHVNSGDQPPETEQVIDECKKIAKKFVEVKSDVNGWIDANGIPSDIVPTNSTWMGRRLGFGKDAISDRFSCCYQNIMLPMYERMMGDGVTLIIRGQKLSDMPSVPLKSGQVSDGIEVLYPIEDWSDEKVMSYLKFVGAPIHPMYSKVKEGTDCLHCSAWWKYRLTDWLQDAHPEAHRVVKQRHKIIFAALEAQGIPHG